MYKNFGILVFISLLCSTPSIASEQFIYRQSLQGVKSNNQGDNNSGVDENAIMCQSEYSHTSDVYEKGLTYYTYKLEKIQISQNQSSWRILYQGAFHNGNPLIEKTDGFIENADGSSFEDPDIKAMYRGSQHIKEDSDYNWDGKDGRWYFFSLSYLDESENYDWCIENGYETLSS